MREFCARWPVAAARTKREIGVAQKTQSARANGAGADRRTMASAITAADRRLVSGQSWMSTRTDRAGGHRCWSL